MTYRFYSRKQIESRAEEKLGLYQQRFGVLASPPVPLDQLIENVFDLRISWETIKAEKGETILGALRPEKRQIVLNEAHLKLFEEKPGLERSTKGHELGHWDLFTDPAKLNHPDLPTLERRDYFMNRRSSQGEVEVVRLLATDNIAYAEYKKLTAKQDEPFVKSAVDYYASVLAMPRFLLVPTMKGIHDAWDVWSSIAFNYQLKELYDLARSFDVTITALTVRLEQLNLLYIDSPNRRIYRNKEEFSGQQTLL